MMNSICDIEFKDYSVSVASFKKACKYHNKINETFSCNNISPRGMCPHLFHKIYPYALALLYGAEISGLNSKQSIVISCPGLHKSISMEISRVRQNNLVEGIKNFLKEIAVKLNLHCNPLYYRVYMKVMEIKERCPYEHKKGETFEFNVGDSPEICPAAFDAMFPGLLKQSDNLSVVCPDHLGQVSFITRRRK